jgi:hypothetical protein
MADPKDITSEARAKMKRLAASMMVDQERLEALVKKDEAELGKLDLELDAVRSTGSSELSAGLEQLRAELAGRLEANREALALVQANFEATTKDMDDLGRFGDRMQREHLRAATQVTLPGDPYSTDVTDAALSSVREHIEKLSGEAALGAELAAAKRPPTSAESEEARARAQLAAMKAARKKDGGEGGGGEGGGTGGRTL